MVAVYFAISFNHKCREQTTMNDINLENLSVSELDNLKSNIDYALNNRRHSELIKTRQKIEELIEKSSFSLQEVLNVRPTKRLSLNTETLKTQKELGPDAVDAQRGLKSH